MSINTIIALDKQNPRSYHSIEESFHIKKKEPKKLFQIMNHAIYRSYSEIHFSEGAGTIYLKSQGSNAALEGWVRSFGALLLKIEKT